MSLLQEISEPQSRAIIEASRVAVVVAHPDDESIGCGALLQRLANVSVIVITDGAPRNRVYALRAGFESPSAYRDARAAELRAALAAAGVQESQIIEFGVSDQEVCRSLVPISQRLTSLFESRGITAVFTHAFEGGHPDHDGVAFCVHAAAAVLGDRAPTIIEMPYYHLGLEGMATQSFCDAQDEIVVSLGPEERRIKLEMMAAHASQAQTLKAFTADVERYRKARDYDFRSLPNKGRILYSQWDCGLRSDEWAPLACKALATIGLRPDRHNRVAQEDRVVMSTEKLHKYVTAELQNEIRALEGRIASLESAPAPAKSSFLTYKLKELYWTVTRLCGLG